MAGANVGNAYVTLMPSMSGFASKLTGDMRSSGAQAGSSFGDGMAQGINSEMPKSEGALSKLGGVASAAAGVAAAGFAALVGGVVAAGKAALDSYADYEQLVGGVETLYGDAADTMVARAKDAFKTAGMSANEYMETSTSFAASLVTSLGGDTAKAADMADLAITDMSDNANKMGSDFESIQNAYQGFAKQNYTMLDNLKLGYGGTKGEMERLIEDANKLREAQGINADLTIDSYADVVTAIHEVQTNMGITGTTAKEAAETISGSIGMAKGAWANFLTALGDDDADFSKVTDDLLYSIEAVAKNVGPRIAVIGSAIVEAFPTVLSSLGEVLAPVVSEALASAWNIAAGALGKAGLNLPTVDASQIMAVLGQVAQVAQTVMSVIGGALSYVMGLAARIAEAVSPAIETLRASLEPVVSQVSASLMPALATVGAAIDNLVSAVLPVLSAALSTIAPIVGQVAGAVVGLATHVAQTVSPVIDQLSALISAALPYIQGLFEGFGSVVSGVIDAVFPYIESVVSAAMDVISAVISTVMAALSGDWDGVWNGIGNIASSVWNLITTVVTGGIDAVKGIVDSALGFISSIWETAWNGISSFLSDAWEGIKSGAKSGIDAVLSTVTGIKDSIFGFFSNAGQWLLDSGSAIVDGLKNGIMGAIDGVKNAVSGAIQNIRNLFPFSPAKEGPFSGHGYTTYSGEALMGDFAASIRAQAGVVAAATSDVMGVARDGLSADLTVAQGVRARSAGASGTGSQLSSILSVLERMAASGRDVYMDTDKVSSVLAARSRTAMAGRGLA